MSSAPPVPQFSLEKTQILLVDGDVMSTEIVSQILRGFGARAIQKIASVRAAKATLSQSRFDLIFVDPANLEQDGYDFVAWLRRESPPPTRFCPLMIVSAHTQRSRIDAARDCGANFVVAKPLAPRVLLDRMVWMANEARPFVESQHYVGPERRFKTGDAGPMVGGRRQTDRAPSSSGRA